MGLKKKIFFTWVAVEIVTLPLTIPATAQIVERISFSVPARIAAVELDAEPGISRFVVASNAPFAVISEGAIGKIDVDIQVQGHINKTPFGTKAQMPGVENACVTSVSASPSIIYQAERKTAAKRGQILEQAIVVEMRYDAALAPRLRFEAISDKEVKALPDAQACAPNMI